MRLLRGDAFDGLFRSFERTAFHLEVQDVYHTREESAPFQRFLDGEPDDLGWQRPWLELVREVTDAGRSVRRLRVVPVPHLDYTRWLLSISGFNVEAGEDIRWLPRPEAGGLAVAFDDFWLFDDRRVVFSLFGPDGGFAGGALTEDPAIVRHCARTRTTLWTAGTPHDDYVKG
ncbi:hypothetical protein FHR83_004198 [Actinoplanes campanulatus]|uniref:DUF6879 domain-containing protein n=1 Tax=Actinoplanes campanulatus TaxID=113559 RepID=A0A7W5AHV3_9ACTN|nr:DUF6879 family protein [Actinoplanes campanulatus]MBB3096528.1 hypothetical protein [Actinoplanes campanulatus]GGN17620.1 hypothetical protein GCM10010109_30410 [Actinoplanes campanulatus]GID38595.1 hypothetical protein Aca09nite_51010 [Actinoplanes campanulatus]